MELGLCLILKLQSYGGGEVQPDEGTLCVFVGPSARLSIPMGVSANIGLEKDEHKAPLALAQPSADVAERRLITSMSYRPRYTAAAANNPTSSPFISTLCPLELKVPLFLFLFFFFFTVKI